MASEVSVVDLEDLSDFENVALTPSKQENSAVIQEEQNTETEIESVSYLCCAPCFLPILNLIPWLSSKSQIDDKKILIEELSNKETEEMPITSNVESYDILVAENKKYKHEISRISTELEEIKKELSAKLELSILNNNNTEAREFKQKSLQIHRLQNINIMPKNQEIKLCNLCKEKSVEDLEQKNKKDADYQRVTGELTDKIQILEGNLKNATEEKDGWKIKYELLEEKVRPFTIQLEAYVAEKNYLLEQNSTTLEDLAKLEDRFANLLGHHNQKQKIRYVMQMKEEIQKLKNEIAKLRNGSQTPKNVTTPRSRRNPHTPSIKTPSMKTSQS